MSTATMQTSEGPIVFELFDEETCRALVTRSVELARERGALGVLPHALDFLAVLRCFEGELDGAEAALQEARQLAADAGIGYAAYIDLDAEYAEGPRPAAGLVQIIPPRNGEDAPHNESLPPYYCAYPWMSVYVHAADAVRQNQS